MTGLNRFLGHGTWRLGHRCVRLHETLKPITAGNDSKEQDSESGRLEADNICYVVYLVAGYQLGQAIMRDCAAAPGVRAG